MVVIDGQNLDDDYVVRISPYNGTGPTGGDSLTQDLNIWYEVSCLIPSTSPHPRDSEHEIWLTLLDMLDW